VHIKTPQQPPSTTPSPSNTPSPADVALPLPTWTNDSRIEIRCVEHSHDYCYSRPGLQHFIATRKNYGARDMCPQ